MAAPSFTQTIYQLGYSIRVVVTIGQSVGNGVSSLAIVIPGGIQSDNNYAVYAIPNWNTSVFLDPTTKTTTGFTLSFGTVSPAAPTVVSVDWMLFRAS